MKKFYLILSLIILVAFSCSAKPTIDLYPTSFTVSPSSVSSGSTFTERTIVAWTGSAPTQIFYIYYYLSTDNVLDGNDIYLGSFPVERTENPQTCQKVLTMPCSTTAGQYYIIAYVDATNLIPETNEINNKIYAPITVTAALPDLIVQNPGSTPTSISNGSNAATLSCRIANTASCGTAAASTLKIYINDVNSLSGSPILLTSIGVGSITAGSYIDESQSNVSIPYYTGSFPQTKYIIFQADANNAVTESNETNNTAYTTVTIVAPTLTDIGISYEQITNSNGIICSNNCPFGGSLDMGCTSPNYYSGYLNFGISVSNNTSIAANNVDVQAVVYCGNCTPPVQTTQDYYINVPANSTVSCCGYSLGVSGYWGAANITYTIDPNNLISENNESNNVGNLSIMEGLLLEDKRSNNSANSINDESNNLINLFPNPVSTNLTMDFGKDATWIGSAVEIMNMEGQIVNKFTIDNLSTSINVSNLKEGLYLVKFINSDQLITKKLLIQH